MSFYLSNGLKNFSKLEKFLEEQKFKEILENLVDNDIEEDENFVHRNILKYLALDGLGRYNESMEVIEQAASLAVALENHDLSVKSMTFLASVKWKTGDFDGALEVLQMVNALARQNKDRTSTYYTARIQMIFANVFMAQGFYSLSSDYTDHALRLWEEIGEEWNQGSCLNNLGYINLFRGDLDLSINYYLRAIPIYKKEGNRFGFSQVYLNLIYAYSQAGQVENASNLLIELREYRDNNPSNESVSNHYLLATALYYKYHPRLQLRFKSEELFLKLRNKLTLEFQYHRLVRIHLTELYLMELKYTGEKEIITDIRELIDDLVSLTSTQGSDSFKAENHLLKSKLYQIEGRLDLAEEEILEGKRLSNKGEFKLLGKALEKEYVDIIDKKKIYHSIKEDGEEIDDLALNNMREMVNDIIRFKLRKDVKSEIIPVMFQIIAEGGVSIYDNKFTDDIELNEDLISNFLSAINSFSKEAFKTKGNMEQIKIDKYNILVKSYNDYLFVYVYKGISIEANIHFNTLVERLVLQFKKQIVNAFSLSKNIAKIIDNLVIEELGITKEQ